MILHDENSNLFTWRFEIPTAAIIPNITRNMPPMTGSGMVMNTAPNFPKIPRTIIRIPVVWRTSLLPTWKKRKKRPKQIIMTLFWHKPQRLCLLFYTLCNKQLMVDIKSIFTGGGGRTLTQKSLVCAMVRQAVILFKALKKRKNK